MYIKYREVTRKNCPLYIFFLLSPILEVPLCSTSNLFPFSFLPFLVSCAGCVSGLSVSPGRPVSGAAPLPHNTVSGIDCRQPRTDEIQGV